MFATSFQRQLFVKYQFQNKFYIFDINSPFSIVHSQSLSLGLGELSAQRIVPYDQGWFQSLEAALSIQQCERDVG